MIELDERKVFSCVKCLERDESCHGECNKIPDSEMKRFILECQGLSETFYITAQDKDCAALTFVCWMIDNGRRPPRGQITLTSVAAVQ